MRLFVAIPVAVPAFLDAGREVLGDASARLVARDHLHLTLRFLGDVADPAPIQVALASAVAGRTAIDARATGLGAFPSAAHARVLWFGLDAPGLAGLARDVVDATRAFGEPPDPRPFSAHVTLARLRIPRSLARQLAATRAPTWHGKLERVVLFASHLGPAGPRYEPLAEWRLGEA